MNTKNINFYVTKGALGNLSMSENKNSDMTPDQVAYYRGLIVGIVSVMYDVFTDGEHAGAFDAAMSKVSELLPDDCIELAEVLPPAWVDFEGKPMLPKKTPMAILPGVNPDERHLKLALAAIDYLHRRIGSGDLRDVARKLGMY